jgi:hypothetical protein
MTLSFSHRSVGELVDYDKPLIRADFLDAKHSRYLTIGVDHTAARGLRVGGTSSSLGASSVVVTQLDTQLFADLSQSPARTAKSRTPPGVSRRTTT